VVEKLLVRPPEERPPSAEAVIQLLDEAGRAPRVDSEETGAEEVALAPEGERRQATVVVARVVGYADLLERLEPAELEGRMARLEASVQDVARRHGGIMNEFAADRFSLVFGLPRTHEDDVLRAVRSTLELQSLSELGAEREGGKPLALRVGVATGTLVVRPAGNSSRVYQLAGAPPERAERLCTEAAPGEAWVDPPSHRAAEPYFDLEAAGTLPVGVDGASVEVGRVTAGRTGKAPTDSGRLELARLTPYAGREAELTLLEVAFQKVLGGEGRFATVIGEAGIGKSRLILEFRRRAKEGSARVLHGHCQPYADGGPYHPFVQVLHQVLGMDGANLLVDEESIAGRVEKVDPALGRYLPFYLHLLSVPGTRHSLPRGLEGEQLRAGIRESLIALVTLACDEAPIVLTLEDWHWADEASGELLKQLVGVLDPHPLFVIVTARPGYGAEWDSSLPRLLVHLTALDLEESSQVLEALLGVDEVAEELANTLHERSGGNPFFLEELTHSLREAGMLRVEEGRAELSGTSDGMHLPTTIQGVIRTRLDRIPAETREVLRSAAVLGREFSLPLLERIGLDRYALERAVKHLTEAGVLQQIQVVPEPRFRFRHALTQEVAYDTLLHHQRTSLHERAGRALVELYPERLSEEAPALARHFSRAERWREAVRYGVVAAERARELSEFADALQTLQEVEGWLARLPGDRWRRELEAELLLEEEELCETLGLRGRQEELLDRLEALAKAGVGEGSEPTEEDRALRAEIQRRRGDLYTLLRRYEEAEEVLEAARELARETGDPKLQGSVLRSSGLAAWHGGELERALEWIDEALALARERGDADAMIGDLNNKAQILKDRGDHRTALACLEEALQLLDESPSEPRRAYTLHIMSNQHRALGNQDRALELLTEASRITREQHLPMSRCFHLTAIAHIHLTRGRLEEAVDTYREAVASAREARYAEGLARSLHPLGELLAAIGREEEALSYLEEAARIFAQLGQSRTEADALEKVAEVGTRVGDWERVHDAWQACLRRSETLNDPEVRVRALEGLARAQRELGAEPRVVRGSLEEALQVAREQGDRRREAGILNSLGILEWRQGAYRAALERYERALEIFRDLDDPVHEGLILNSLGVTLRAMGRTAEARAHLEKALEVHRSTGQSLLEGHALAALAEVHLEEEEPDAARDCFGRSLEIRRSIGDRAGEAWMLHGLARVEALLGGTAAAEERLAEVRRIAGELEDGELVQACEELRP
jgi:tetratricopeptide (TPR) repeat protein/class 3 adenylate cyclase